MAYTWKPVNDPPSRHDISCYSPDAQRVLDLLRLNYQMKCSSQFNRQPTNLKTLQTRTYRSSDKYYNEVYKKSFIKEEVRSPSPPIETENGDSSRGMRSLFKEEPVHPSEINIQLPVRANGDSASLECFSEQGESHLCDVEEENVMPPGRETSPAEEFKAEIQISNNTDDHLKTIAAPKESNYPGPTLSVPAEVVASKQHQSTAKIFPVFTRKRQLSITSLCTASHLQGQSKDMKRPGNKKSATTNDSKKISHKRGSSCPEQGTQHPVVARGGGSMKNILFFQTVDEQQKIIDEFCHADEVVIQLSYAGGDTQLRERTSTKKTAVLPEDDTPDAVLLAATPLKSLSQVLSVPLVGSSEEQKKWCQRFLLSIMSSNVRKICYDAQEMMSALMTFTKADPVSVGSKWLSLDPGIACWLLDPDNPPDNFSQLYKSRITGRRTVQGNDDSKEVTVNAASCLDDFAKLSRCMRQLYDELKKAKLWSLFFFVEMPLVPLLAGMELTGIKVNPSKFYVSSQILKTRTCQLEESAHDKAGKVFQLNSHVQLRQILFDELKLDEAVQGARLERTAGQNLKSTSENVLTKLQDIHPLPGIILEYRKMQKLKSTYVDGYQEYITDNHICCTWEQTAAVSGRLQSTNPNIQNIPKQPIPVTIDGKGGKTSHHILHMREPFVSREGFTLISADFQSIELRILAHFSDDELLLKVFQDEEQTDIFVQMTSQWLGIPTDHVKEEDREKTKRIVYSLVYGAGSEKISEILNITKDKAKSFTKSFLDKFSGIKQFTQRCVSQCRLSGHVTSLLGRRRIIKHISSANIFQKLHAERQAVNFVIQGSAADVCKLAMLCTVRELTKRPHLKARLLIQIHDELLFEVHDDQATECKELIRGAMESVANIKELNISLKTPLPVSLSVGKDWGHLVKC